MNLNKTEKLLAARKKLKEFQLNKKLPIQKESTKTQDELVKTSQQQNKIATTPPHEVQIESNENVTTNNSTNTATNTSVIPINIKNLHLNVEVESSMPLSENDTKTDIEESIVPDSNRIDSTDIKVKESSTNVDNNHLQEPISQISKEASESVSMQLSKESDENENKYSLNNVSSSDTAREQKEHLLEMANAVANVLTENADENESAVFDNNLKYHNEFLTSCLEEQKQVVNRLHVQVNQYSSKLSELQAVFATKDAEFEAKLAREISQLKEQLQIYTQTTGILIAEKAELTSTLAQNQKTLKHNTEEIEELSGKLKNSQTYISELEKELNLLKNNSESTGKMMQKVQKDYDELNNKYFELRKEKEDLILEVSELKQKLNLKNTELFGLQQELKEKTALLSLNELKIQQLVNTSQEMQTLEHQHHTAVALEQQLVQMRDTLKTVTEENNETSKQYQNYVRQLEAQQEKLKLELDNRNQTIAELESSKENYAQRLSNLEQHLQQEKEKTEDLITMQDHRDQTETLMKNINELTLEQERLHIVITEKETDIEALTKELQELRNVGIQNAEASKLAVALESEQLGASRAVLQNQQLKQQLSEMHDAFILLSNTKLDLTEQLQSERTIGRKLNIELNKVESEIQQLKNQLEEKDLYLLELEKEKLQNAQITDQINHYQAQSYQSRTLQEELQQAMASIENLKKENQQLSKKLCYNNQKETPLATESENLDTDNNLIKEQQDDNVNIDKNLHKDAETRTLSQATNTDSPCYSEPAKRLEIKFKEIMEKNAELIDDKQRLEHLVLQLQSETETIGEYITLYQKQRAILQERAKEKNQAFQQVIEQRNHQQEQLHKLKVLVTDLIKKKSNTSDVAVDSCTADHPEENSQNIAPAINDKQNNGDLIELVEHNTTSQILELLTEIKDCKDTCTLTANFHPCPWCSGKLITV